jgi:translocation and assembly module TamB
VHLDSIPLGAIDRLAALDLTTPDGALAELAERTLSLRVDLAGTRAAPTLDVLGALHPRAGAASGFGDLSLGDRAPATADTAVTGLDQLLDGALLRARVADGRAAAFVGLLAPGRALARLDAEAPVAFSLAPVRAALVEGPTRVVLRADSVELAAVGRAFPDAGLRGGLLRLDAHAEGTRLPLTLSGALAVSDGAVDVASFGVGVRRLTADVRLAGDSITVAALHGESATPNHRRAPGRFDVGGVVHTRGADGRAALGLDFTLAADRLPVLRSRAQGDVDASARLTLRGPLDAATLGGRATVDRAELRLGPLGAPTVVGAETPEFTRLVDSLTARPPGLAARLGEALVRNLRFEGLRLAMGEDVWLRSPEVDVQLAGSVQVNHAARRDGRRAAGLDLTGLALGGELTMPRGTYRLDAGVIQRVFELQKGALRFGGGAGLDPDLDIVAAYTARRGGDAPAAATALSSSGGTVTALATIGGTVSHPTLALSSDDGSMTREQVLSWLVTGQATFDPASADAYRRIAGTEVASRMATALADRVAGGFFDLVRVTPGSAGAASGPGAAGGATAGGGAEGSSTLGGGAQSFTASRLALGKQIGRRAFLSVNAGTCGLLGGRGDAAMDLDAAQFSNALGLTLDYRLRLDGGVRVSSEPSGAALTCNATASSPTGIVTPRQWALDVFRTWRF